MVLPWCALAGFLCGFPFSPNVYKGRGKGSFPVAELGAAWGTTGRPPEWRLFPSDKATSQLLLETDWESILQICDLIRQGDTQ